MAGTKKKNSKAVIIGIIIFAVILAVGAGIFLWAVNTPGNTNIDKAVEEYFAAVSYEDTDLYEKACYPIKWQNNFNSGSAGSTLEEQIREAFSMQSGATYSDVEIVGREKLDKSYADKMTDSLKTRYGVNIKVSQIKKVNFTVNTVFGGEASSTGTITRYCYKTGGKWFFLADPDVIVDIGIEE